MLDRFLQLWKNQKKLLGFFFLVSVAVIFGVSRWIYLSSKNEIHIAVVAPMSGDSESNGRSYLQGIKLFIDPINSGGGIDGKHIVLDVYDDQNKADLAKLKANEIANAGIALAVVGHNNSDCSIAGGEIYKREEIPAVTPASTNVKVTLDNKWYFRTIFNDNSQGRFIANYIKKILKINNIKIVSEELSYGKFLAGVLEETSASLDMEISYKREFNTKSPTLEADLKAIVNEIKEANDNHIIFMAMHTPEGALFLKLLKEAEVKNPILAPDAFASQGFVDKITKFKREKTDPGYYSNGLYVTTPLIFDNASQKAQAFKESYESKYGTTPDWRAIYAYDSIMTIAEAIRKTDIDGNKKNIKAERAKIRDYLESINNPAEAIEGATGLNYFDENGDSPKPVSIGVYKNNNVISSLTQLQLVRDPAEIANPERAIAEERMLKVDNKYLYKTNVVYTGIEINEITDLKISTLTYTMDFYIWFRYNGKISPEQIEFLNSIGKLDKWELIDKDDTEQMSYRSYHVKGKFKAGALPVRFVLEQHALGVSFQHKNMTRNNLIYVIDVVGMGINGKKQIDSHKKSQVLSSAIGWEVASTWYFQDTLSKTTLGSPRYLNMQDSHIDYSRFNMGVRIQKDEISLRRFISSKISMYVLVFCIVSILGLGIVSSLKSYKIFSNLIWFLQSLGVYLILVASEVELVERLVESDSIPSIRLVLSIYDLLWWVIPSVTLTQAVERFLWTPLEKRTEHKIPTVVRKFANFLIYLLTIFGIVAFVYDQKITSLLATSGVVAMIIGLAIQVNISNVFSGIAINLERPFRVGDWIKIGAIDEGKVVDITWRTTRIQMRNMVIMSIPNSMASEAAIVNFNMPEGVVEAWFTIHIDPKALPQRVVKVLMDALLSSEGVLSVPAPYARFNEFSDWSADYLFGYCFKDYGKKNSIRRSVWSNVWTHLHRAGIKPSFQRQEIFMHKGTNPKIEDVRNPLAVVNELYMFDTFTPEEKKYLAKRLRPLQFYEGDCIVRAGEQNYSMFVITEGVVSVQAPLETGDFIEVARLGSGNFFGEMSLLTGAKRTANIIASSHTYIYEITKEDIAPLLEKHPEIYKNVKQVFTQRKENLQNKTEEALYVAPPKKESLFKKIKRKGYALLGLQKEVEEEISVTQSESKE